MIKLKFIGIVLILIFQSCDKSDDIQYLERITSVKTVSLPDSTKIDETFSINLIIYGPSGCSEYSRFQTNKISDTTSFTIYEKRDKSSVCTTQPIEIPVSISNDFNTQGMNYLKFNDGTGQTLIDSIFVYQ